jgi:hypothetical protein
LAGRVGQLELHPREIAIHLRINLEILEADRIQGQKLNSANHAVPGSLRAFVMDRDKPAQVVFELIIDTERKLMLAGSEVRSQFISLR